MKRVKHFPEGPAINVDFHIDTGIVQKISVVLASKPGLTCTVFADKKESGVSEIEKWITSYLQKNTVPFSLPLNWGLVSPFTQKVLYTLSKIPFGQTLSYGEVAAMIQQEKAARAVGSACGRNPFLLVVPCHRILASNQRLGGFTGGIEIKKRLLAFEH